MTASIVGPGFSSFTRSFEEVNAHATAGGNDRATLYGESQQTQWQQGTDFVSYRESQWQREARGFGQVETYESNQPVDVRSNSFEQSAQPLNLAPEANGDSRAQEPGVRPEAEATSPKLAAVGSISPESVSWDTASWSSQWTVDLSASESLASQSPTEQSYATQEMTPDRDGTNKWQYLEPEPTAERLHLPEEAVLGDADLEQAVLEETFRQFDELFS